MGAPFENKPGSSSVMGRTTRRVTFTLLDGVKPDAVSRIPVIVEILGYPEGLYIPIVVLGQTTVTLKNLHP